MNRKQLTVCDAEYIAIKRLVEKGVVIKTKATRLEPIFTEYLTLEVPKISPTSHVLQWENNALLVFGIIDDLPYDPKDDPELEITD